MKTLPLLTIVSTLLLAGCTPESLPPAKVQPDVRTQESVSSEEEAKNEDGEHVQITATDLEMAALQKDYICTYESTDQFGNTTKATSYIKRNGDIRQTSVSTNKIFPEPVEMEVLKIGKNFYSWPSKNATQGTLFVLPEDDEDYMNDPNAPKDPEHTMDCVTWTPDDSMFVLPSIKFVNFQDAMNDLMQP